MRRISNELKTLMKERCFALLRMTKGVVFCGGRFVEPLSATVTGQRVTEAFAGKVEEAANRPYRAADERMMW
jgi:hypothetical protein